MPSSAGRSECSTSRQSLGNLHVRKSMQSVGREGQKPCESLEPNRKVGKLLCQWFPTIHGTKRVHRKKISGPMKVDQLQPLVPLNWYANDILRLHLTAQTSIFPGSLGCPSVLRLLSFARSHNGFPRLLVSLELFQVRFRYSLPG